MTARHTTKLQALLVDEAFEGEVFLFEPLSRHTSYHIGGPARFFLQVSSLHALTSVIEASESEGIPWVVLGKGSNVLASDEGFDGVVITLGGEFRSCCFDEEKTRFIVGAGTSLASLVQEAFKRGLAGLEFAVGTPGTVGGALRMNAGSKDEWIGSRVHSVTTYHPAEGLKRYDGSDIQWEYRWSSLPSNEIVVECEISVEPTVASHIRGKMEALLSIRRKNQPLNLPSCGSVFKNPPGELAGMLIDKAGLKGRTCGGAMVSEKHANFIVNTGGATAADVKSLIELVRAEVKKAYGIELQPEVKYLGFAQE